MTPNDPAARERGVALILVLILTVLLYALVAELVTTARTARLTGENDALMARMRNHMGYTLSQVEDLLLEDLAAGSAGDEGGAGMGAGPGGIPGAGAGPGAGGEGEEGEEEASAIADCSQDAWYEPTAYADNELTTYVWVEDENRKFNVLSLLSPDEEYATESRERFIRLIDVLREDTEFDLTAADGETIAEALTEWMTSRMRNEDTLPRPPLKSDKREDPGRQDVSLPIHLDELMLLPQVNEDLFYDKVLDSRIILGLESVLTVWTSLVFDPGDPEKLARQRALNPDAPEPPEPDPSSPENEEDPTPEGLGVLININTASRPVLRSLFSASDMPDSVLDAILLYRNEEEEVEEAEDAVPDDYFGDLNEGDRIKRQVFTDLELLEDIPEFQNMANAEIKDKFKALLTTKSDVFSIHMASLFKRNEERRVFVLRRERSIVVRQDDGEEGKLHPLILREARRGIRVQPIDFPDENIYDNYTFDDMDQFSQEERAWNPFYLDFFRPKDERERMFNYQHR